DAPPAPLPPPPPMPLLPLQRANLESGSGSAETLRKGGGQLACMLIGGTTIGTVGAAARPLAAPPTRLLLLPPLVYAPIELGGSCDGREPEIQLALAATSKPSPPTQPPKAISCWLGRWPGCSNL
ncbi:hypothetical protein Vretimale_11055, partial [Volvox reticuliferus]